MNKVFLSLAFVSSLALGQSEPLQTSAIGGVSLSTQQTVTGAKTFSAALVTTGDVAILAVTTSVKLGLHTSLPGLWLTSAAPSLTNFTLLFDNTNIILNAPSGGYVAVRSANDTVAFFSTTYGVRIPLRSLATCGSTIEGAVMTDSASGGTSGKRTKFCGCTSDGAGTPGYKWQNLATGTLGTTTTCGTE